MARLSSRDADEVGREWRRHAGPEKAENSCCRSHVTAGRIIDWSFRFLISCGSSDRSMTASNVAAVYRAREVRCEDFLFLFFIWWTFYNQFPLIIISKFLWRGTVTLRRCCESLRGHNVAIPRVHSGNDARYVQRCNAENLNVHACI